jgi:hypothetical protein
MDDFDDFLEIIDFGFPRLQFTKGLTVFMNWINLDFIRGSISQKQMFYIF